MTAAQGQNQPGSFKRQKIGSGPVVTRYPLPGPVITKYGPPPQGMPYHGTHGPQPQFTPQYAQQPLAPSHNFQQPQPNYGPQGYAPQPQYSQYGQYHAPVPQHQVQGYSPGYVAQQPVGYSQNVAPQVPYGYAAPQQYSQQQPPFVSNGYNASQVGPYAQPPPPQQMQPVAPYFNGQPGYQQPQQYPMQTYQPGINAPPPQTQQYGPETQTQYSHPPQQGPPHGYPGPQGQPFAPQVQQYPNQHAQQWRHARAPAPPLQASPLQAPPASATQTPSASAVGAAALHGLPHANGCTADTQQSVVPANTNEKERPRESESRAASEGPPPDNSVRPYFRAIPIIDPFDIEWEDSIKDYEYPKTIRYVAISTPITLKHEEFPALCGAGGSTQIKSKYVQSHNLEVFILPIEKSLHWPGFNKKDPALAKIHWTMPSISEKDWIEFQEARKWHLESLKNSPSPEIARRSLETAPVQPVKRSRSRSGTPNLRADGPPAFDDDGTWAANESASRHDMPQLDGDKEALLASLGVSGLPKPVSDDDEIAGYKLNTFKQSFRVANKDSELRNMLDSNRPPSRQDSGYASGRPSLSTAGSKYSVKSPPPPPPPPSSRSRGYGSHGSRGHSPAYGSSHSRNSSRNQSRSASTNRSPEESPLSPTSAALLGHIPMEEETNDRKRRQGDDHYVRRRPQPRVAEAFRYCAPGNTHPTIV